MLNVTRLTATGDETCQETLPEIVLEVGDTKVSVAGDAAETACGNAKTNAETPTARASVVLARCGKRKLILGGSGRAAMELVLMGRRAPGDHSPGDPFRDTVPSRVPLKPYAAEVVPHEPRVPDHETKVSSRNEFSRGSSRGGRRPFGGGLPPVRPPARSRARRVPL